MRIAGDQNFQKNGVYFMSDTNGFDSSYLYPRNCITCCLCFLSWSGYLVCHSICYSKCLNIKFWWEVYSNRKETVRNELSYLSLEEEYITSMGNSSFHCSTYLTRFYFYPYWNHGWLFILMSVLRLFGVRIYHCLSTKISNRSSWTSLWYSSNVLWISLSRHTYFDCLCSCMEPFHK